MRRRVGRIALALFALIVVASVLSYPRGLEGRGGPILVGAHVSPEVLATLERSCQDCHSDSTHFPWYSYVAPVSWLIASDVKEGREHLNLSRWSEASIVRRERWLSDIANQVQDRGMPLPLYILIHPRARLSDEDVKAVFQWTQEERARLIAENAR